MKTITISLITLLLLSCNMNGNEDTTQIELGENKEVDLSLQCHCDSLIIDTLGILSYHSEIFSGICFSTYPNSDQKYIEKEILKGEYHGKVTYFDKQGKELYSETYNKGEAMGDLENQPGCNCMELEMKDENGANKYYLNQTIYTGKCTDNFPNSDQVYLESNYKNGLLHGYTIYYTKDGKVLMMHNYENGEIIKEITPQR